MGWELQKVISRMSSTSAELGAGGIHPGELLKGILLQKSEYFGTHLPPSALKHRDKNSGGVFCVCLACAGLFLLSTAFNLQNVIFTLQKPDIFPDPDRQ